MSSVSVARVLEFVKCEKCKGIFQPIVSQQINIGRTQKERADHSKMCYLCYECFQRWRKVYKKWHELPMKESDWWFKGWDEFIKGRECFIFR